MTTIPTQEVTLPERILSRYPAPLALAWRHVRRSSTKKEEHDRLLDLLEISAMTLATALVSQYRADIGDSPQVEEVLLRMAIASFGWMRLSGYNPSTVDEESPLGAAALPIN
jgi:hypothetical protein